MLVLALLASGCIGLAGRTAGEAAEEATGAVVDESLQAFAEPQNRALLAEILSSPEMRRATANITAGAMDGVLHSLSAQESVEAFSPQMGLLAREIAHQVTLGVDEALAQVSQRPASATGIGRILEGAEETTTTTTWLLPVALVVLFVALAAAVVLLVRATSRARREQEEARERERALAALASTLREAEEQPWGSELQALLQRRAQGDGAGLDRWLRGPGSERHDA